MRCTARVPQLTEDDSALGMNCIHDLLPSFYLLIRVDSRKMRATAFSQVIHCKLSIM